MWDTGTDVLKRRHKRSCPRLGAKPVHCSGSWVTQEESNSPQSGELGWRLVGWTQMEQDYHVPGEFPRVGEKVW